MGNNGTHYYPVIMGNNGTHHDCKNGSIIIVIKGNNCPLQYVIRGNNDAITSVSDCILMINT